MRSTPQRRAILRAFRGGSTEHLSADEIHSRALLTSPDLGRGTVYATLAEFTEVGLLAAVGTSEPVRYETNTIRHAHFRCRLCLRIYDVEAPAPDPAPFIRAGHEVQEINLRGEGICSDCVAFDTGMIRGSRTVNESGASAGLTSGQVAAGQLETPLGVLSIAATVDGVARVAFSEHPDVEFLRELSAAGAPVAAAAHLADATHELMRYFGGEAAPIDCAIDWEVVGARGDLSPLMAIPFGMQRSYHLLESREAPARLGSACGGNPVPIIAPCHRLLTGDALPRDFVGGLERRRWLLDHERHASTS